MISREEAIKWLEKSAPVCVCTSNAFGEFIQGVNKAISDMQKLEKIEQTLKDYDEGKFDKFYCFCRIEQIVKGAEECINH